MSPFKAAIATLEVPIKGGGSRPEYAVPVRAGYVGSLRKPSVGRRENGESQRAYASVGEHFERFRQAAENPGYVLGEALDASGFFALPIEAAATVDTMTGINPVKDPFMAAFPDAPQGGKAIRRIGVDPVGKLLGPAAGFVSDMSKAAGAPIGAATGDGITDSQAEAVSKRSPDPTLR